MVWFLVINIWKSICTVLCTVYFRGELAILDMKSLIGRYIKDSVQVKQSLLSESMLGQLEKVTSLIVAAYKSGNKVIISGNGGSAADAQHMAGEFVSRFYFDRPALPAIAITTDSSIITAIGNDYGYDKVFLRQVEAHAKAGDVYISISTSGNSKNIVESLKISKALGLVTIGLTGKKTGLMDEYCDEVIKVDSDETPRIQEAHLLVEHIICALVEEVLFPEYKK